MPLLLQFGGRWAKALISIDSVSSDKTAGSSGPRLVEVEKAPGASLGISLASAAHRDKQVIVIEKIKAASAADRYSSL